jgi:hypothetical protein
VILVLVGVAVYISLKPRLQISSNVTPTSSSTSTAGASSTIRVLVSTSGLLEEKVSFPIKNAATGDVISSANATTTAQNPNSSISLNKKKIGEVTEYSSMASFSPNNKYFAVLQTLNEGCAGGCLGFYIFVVNLRSGAAQTLQPQPASHDEFVESYTWDGDDVLDVVSYPVSGSYRTSPKQLWRYDLTTGSSILLSTTP